MGRCLISLNGTAWSSIAAFLANPQAKRADDPSFYDAKIATAHFFAQHILSQSASLRAAIVDGGAPTTALSPDQF